jgi:ATP:corrinoid adenosyltransferase
MKVLMIQFIKGSLHYGELDGAKRLAPEFELVPMGKGFVGIRGDSLPFEEHVAAAREALATARERMLSGRYDVIILDLNKPHLQPVYNIVSHLVYSATGADVRDVIIDGKVIMENRKLLTLDEWKILARMGELRQEIVERISHGR